MGLDTHIMGIISLFSMPGVLTYAEIAVWVLLRKGISVPTLFSATITIAISVGGIGGERIGFKYWKDQRAFVDGANGVA